MKQVITAAFTAGSVSLALVLFLSPAQEIGGLDFKVEQLAKVSETNTENISQLLAETSRFRDSSKYKEHLASPSIRSKDSVDSAKFAERISALEIELGELQSSSSTKPVESEKVFREVYSQARQQYFESGSNPHDGLAESEFEKDAGLALGNYSRSIEETLHSIPDIEVSALECKNTICKATYSHIQSVYPDDSVDDGFDVVDKLAQSIEGYSVEVRYTTDPFGNRVMYLQLK